MAADLDHPLILATIESADGKTSQLPIDGWHRIAKALQLGRKVLPCYVLSSKETNKVRTPKGRRIRLGARHATVKA
jgi:hypothetical protein